MGSGSRLQNKHVKLWAYLSVELHYHLLGMNSIRGFQATDHEKVVKFRVSVIQSLLSDTVLNKMRACETGERATFVSGQMPHPPVDVS